MTNSSQPPDTAPPSQIKLALEKTVLGLYWKTGRSQYLLSFIFSTIAHLIILILAARVLFFSEGDTFSRENLHNIFTLLLIFIGCFGAGQLLQGKLSSLLPCLAAGAVFYILIQFI